MQTGTTQKTVRLGRDGLKAAVEKGAAALLARQRPDGCWLFPVEADTTITAEYLLARRFLGIWDDAVAAKAARYLWSRQNADGGWPIYRGGPSELSAGVKTYFALKLCGFKPGDPRMARAREKILALGGAEESNVFTRYQLALFGQFPWEGAPAMPLEVFDLPRWFYFNMHDISYWSRTVVAPLLVILHFKPLCPLPPHLQLDELYRDPARKKTARMRLMTVRPSWKNFFLLVDKLLKLYEKIPRKPWRRGTLKRIESWILFRTDREGGLGAIFPAMVNSVLALRCLGRPFDDPAVRSQWEEVEKLVVEEGDSLMVSPCTSPVWDTALAVLALREAGLPAGDPRLQRAARWLLSKEVKVAGDWRVKNPDAPVGGWYFQFGNEYYPDVDDTAVVVTALNRVRLEDEAAQKQKRAAVARGLRWLAAMPSKNGGWGAFDKDNDKVLLNNIPFADHGALLDPATSDVTGRVIEAMGRSRFRENPVAVEEGIRFLLREQEKEGCWFGRWGVNYIYGTWSVLSALEANGFSQRHPAVARAAAWLKSVQNGDGGWGESQWSYFDPSTKGRGASTPSQTAWALLGLLQTGAGPEDPAVARGLNFLIERQNVAGEWEEEEFTGTGFPKVFCLRYDGYRLYHPLRALAAAYQRWSNS